MPAMYLRSHVWAAICERFKVYTTEDVTKKANELLEEVLGIDKSKVKTAEKKKAVR